MKTLRVLAPLVGAFFLSFSTARADTGPCVAAIAAHEATLVTAAIACGTPEPAWGVACPLELGLLGYTYYEMVEACGSPTPPPPIPPTSAYIGDNPDLYADDDGSDLSDTVSGELSDYSDDLSAWASSGSDSWNAPETEDQEY